MPEKAFSLLEADDLAPDGAPKIRRGRKPKIDLAPRLNDMFVSLGTVWFALDQTCGMAVINQAAALAESLENVAKQNASVARALERLLATGAWGAVLAAAAPIIITVMSHHGILPANVATMFTRTAQNGHSRADTAQPVE